MDNIDIEVSEVIDNLSDQFSEQIAAQAKQIALLRAQVTALNKKLKEVESDSSDTV